MQVGVFLMDDAGLQPVANPRRAVPERQVAGPGGQLRGVGDHGGHATPAAGSPGALLARASGAAVPCAAAGVQKTSAQRMC